MRALRLHSTDAASRARGPAARGRRFGGRWLLAERDRRLIGDRRPRAGIGVTSVDLTKPPVLGDPKALSLPAVVTRELPNGLRLMIVEQHELPLADFVARREERRRDRRGGQAGNARRSRPRCSRKAPATRNSLQIADQEAFLGVDVFAGSGWDATTIQLHTPTAQLDSALALFADIALRPAFPANELERLRQQRLTSLLQVKDRGPEIADRAYRRDRVRLGRVRAAAHGGRGEHEGHPAGGRPAVLRHLLPPQQRDAARGRRREARRRRATRACAVRRLGARPVPAAAYGQPVAARARRSISSTSRAPRSRRSASAASALRAQPRTTSRSS